MFQTLAKETPLGLVSLAPRVQVPNSHIHAQSLYPKNQGPNCGFHGTMAGGVRERVCGL